MKKFLVILIIFGTGGVLGWVLNTQLEPEPDNEVVAQSVAVEPSSASADSLPDDAQPDMQLLFFKLMSESGFKLGDKYDLARGKLAQAQQKELDEELLKYAELLFLRRDSDDKTVEKLEGLLVGDQTDKEVLKKLVIVLTERKAYQKALARLIELNRWSQFPEEYAGVNAKIHEVVKLNIQLLTDKNQKAELKIFYKYLLEQFPTEPEYKWKFARFSHENKEFEYALYLLEELRYVPEYAARVNNLTQSINFHLENAADKYALVDLLRQGENYYVKAMVNGQEPVKLLIDTGASMTVISPELAYSLGLLDEEPEKLMRFQTANGEITAPVITLASLSVGNNTLHNLQAGVLPIANNSALQGLLGMNFLNKYKFFIDQQNLTLELVAQ